MTDSDSKASPPKVLVIADIPSNAQNIIDRVLKPAGIIAWPAEEDAPATDVLVVDVSQLRGDPLAGLRAQRAKGDDAPAVVLAAHFPPSRLRDLFRLGVSDVLLKPYKAVELCRAIYAIKQARAREVNTQILARRLDATREQIRQRTEELRWLSEIGRVVASLKNIDDILTRVVEAAAFLTDAEEANIYLAEADTNEVVLKASKQVGERHGTLERLRTTDTLAGEVYRSGQPILRKPELDAGPVKVQTGFLVQSLVKVPIRARNEVVGVLGVYNRLAPRAFTEHHVSLLTSLADWAGVALDHAQAAAGSEPAMPGSPAATQIEGETTAPQPKVTGVRESLLDLLEEARAEAADLHRRAVNLGVDPGTLAGLRELDQLLQETARYPVTLIGGDQANNLVDMTSVCKKVVEELHLAAVQRGLELALESGETVPMVEADDEQAHRIIQALTAAAIRRTTQGSVTLGVHYFRVQQGRSRDYPLPPSSNLPNGFWLGVRVTDTSPGLSPDTTKAFEEPTVDPTAGRIGPGLTMGEIRLMVESMRGLMWYEQSPSKSTITFALPAN